ncbi:MAG: hypothetical protein RRA35_07030 [Desulfomonilia bacterium]|nr:hypothetical protein [Desulfomonilia bacterium]
MDDENTLMPDPEILMTQAFIDRTRELIHAPFGKILSAGSALRKKTVVLKSDFLEYLISKTEYDMEYQHGQSLGT